jgi:hypothetical protein
MPEQKQDEIPYSALATALTNKLGIEASIPTLRTADQVFRSDSECRLRNGRIRCCYPITSGFQRPRYRHIPDGVNRGGGFG